MGTYKASSEKFLSGNLYLERAKAAIVPIKVEVIVEIVAIVKVFLVAWTTSLFFASSQYQWKIPHGLCSTLLFTIFVGPTSVMNPSKLIFVLDELNE